MNLMSQESVWLCIITSKSVVCVCRCSCSSRVRRSGMTTCILAGLPAAVCLHVHVLIICKVVFYLKCVYLFSMFPLCRHYESESSAGMGALSQNGDISRFFQPSAAHCKRLLQGHPHHPCHQPLHHPYHYANTPHTLTHHSPSNIDQSLTSV